MDEVSREEAEKRKKAVFDAMSPRRQKFVLKLGYDRWDPFQEPQEPIDIRKDRTRRTSQMLIRDFLQSCPPETYSNTFARGAFEMCLGIINDDEKTRGMYAFACWYRDLLEREGHEPG